MCQRMSYAYVCSFGTDKRKTEGVTRFNKNLSLKFDLSFHPACAHKIVRTFFFCFSLIKFSELMTFFCCTFKFTPKLLSDLPPLSACRPSVCLLLTYIQICGSKQICKPYKFKYEKQSTIERTCIMCGKKMAKCLQIPDVSNLQTKMFTMHKSSTNRILISTNQE